MYMDNIAVIHVQQLPHFLTHFKQPKMNKR